MVDAENETETDVSGDGRINHHGEHAEEKSHQHRVKSLANAADQ
jgi:hypothetical protein